MKKSQFSLDQQSIIDNIKQHMHTHNLPLNEFAFFFVVNGDAVIDRQHRPFLYVNVSNYTFHDIITNAYSWSDYINSAIKTAKNNYNTQTKKLPTQSHPPQGHPPHSNSPQLSRTPKTDIVSIFTSKYSTPSNKTQSLTRTLESTQYDSQETEQYNTQETETYDTQSEFQKSETYVTETQETEPHKYEQDSNERAPIDNTPSVIENPYIFQDLMPNTVMPYDNPQMVLDRILRSKIVKQDTQQDFDPLSLFTRIDKQPIDSTMMCMLLCECVKSLNTKITTLERTITDLSYMVECKKIKME